MQVCLPLRSFAWITASFAGVHVTVEYSEAVAGSSVALDADSASTVVA